jgi:patatin-like phospholipase/acyl hydrolase
MSLLLLRRIEEKRPGFLAASDLFVGTSAGGISAMILAADDDPVNGLENAIRFWEESPIFLRRPRHALAGFAGAAPLFSNRPLQMALQKVLGDKTLEDLPHKVLVASIQLDSRAENPELRSWRPRSLSNLDVERGAYLKGSAVDIAMRSAAAPVIWPIHQGYVDGGLFANDPSMLALSRVLDERRKESTPGGHSREVLQDISLFSVGEGQVPHYLQTGTEYWGWQQWLFHRRRPFALLELALNSTAEAISEQCQLLLGNQQYYRLNPDTKPPAGRTMHMSDPVSFAKSVLHRAIAPVETMVDPLHASLQHARAVGNTYDLSPVLSWIDDFGWRREGTAPTPAGSA